MILSKSKIKSILYKFFLITQIKYSVELSCLDFSNIICESESENLDLALAVECCRNPTRTECSSVTSQLISLNTDVNEKATANHVKIISEIISITSWDITKLNFKDQSIDASVYNVILPSFVQEINLSNNPLKYTNTPIPNSFIKNLKYCPFEQTDKLEFSSCTSTLLSLCSSSNIICNSKVQNTVVNTIPNTKPTPNTNTNTNTNNNTNNNTNTNTNTNTNNNNNNVNNNTNNNNDNDVNTDSNSDNNTNNNNSTSNNNNNTSTNDSSENSLSQSSVFTFIYGLITSLTILIVIFTILYIMRKYLKKKKVVKEKKIAGLYEKKPLIPDLTKDKPSTISNTGTGTEVTPINYCVATSSQTSSTTSATTRHKRFLYIFDDGSVMMSKSLNSVNQQQQQQQQPPQESIVSSINPNGTSFNNNIPSPLGVSLTNPQTIQVKSPTIPSKLSISITTTTTTNKNNNPIIKTHSFQNPNGHSSPRSTTSSIKTNMISIPISLQTTSSTSLSGNPTSPMESTPSSYISPPPPHFSTPSTTNHLCYIQKPSSSYQSTLSPRSSSGLLR